MNTFNVIWKLHVPILIFGILVYVVVKGRKSETSTKFNLSLLGLINTELSIKQVVLMKIIVVSFMAILLAGYYLMIDFTQFYPQKLRMTVHFDKRGLEELYDEIGISEIDGLRIDMNDDSTKKEYIRTSDKTIKEHFGFVDFFTKALLDSTANIVSEGSTTFIVKKEQGLQNYYIEEASGTLTHSLFEPKQEVKPIKTSFSKTVSSNDKIKFNYFSVFFGKKVIISPLFTENLISSTKEGSKENVQLDHFLYGITTLRVSPFPVFSNTLYLYRAKGKLVPICYAIYIDE